MNKQLIYSNHFDQNIFSTSYFSNLYFIYLSNNWRYLFYCTFNAHYL